MGDKEVRVRESKSERERGEANRQTGREKEKLE